MSDLIETAVVAFFDQDLIQVRLFRAKQRDTPSTRVIPSFLSAHSSLVCFNPITTIDSH